MTTAGKSWSFEKIASVQAALRSRPLSAVAAEMGCSPANLRRRLAVADDSSGKQVYELRLAGMEFRDIAVELGLPVEPATTRRLYMRLVRYCERAGVEYPQPEKRATSPRSWFKESDLRRIVALLEERAARLEATDNWYVAFVLSLSLREVKTGIAELRRRGIIASGIVPTTAGVEEAALRQNSAAAMDRVLCAIVEARKRDEDESLATLCDKLPFSRSTINLSIVRLRDDGYLLRRGHLALRNAR